MQLSLYKLLLEMQKKSQLFLQSRLRTDAQELAPSVMQINEDGNNEEATDKNEWKVAKRNGERPNPMIEIDDRNNNRHRILK